MSSRPTCPLAKPYSSLPKPLNVLVIAEDCDEYLRADGLTVVIGSEHFAPDLQRFSLVLSTYREGRSVGAVGVIGPTRMHYSRAINAVETLSKAISRTVGARS